MYKSFLILALSLITLACSKPSVADDAVTPVDTDQVLATGSFINSSLHSASGTAKFIKDKDGKRFLLLENFKTDNGPDLRIYLSTSLKADNFTEISSKLTLGNVRIAVPDNVDIKSQKFVLIWCKAFSVLFGSAELK
jgi:hypothetical protein